METLVVWRGVGVEYLNIKRPSLPVHEYRDLHYNDNVSQLPYLYYLYDNIKDQAVIPLKSICWHLPELLALMSAAGFSSPTNVDFHKCRHIQMSPHLSGYIHPQPHNSLAKNRINGIQKSFKYSELRAKLSLNLYKHLQNAASRGACEMEVLPLLTKMSASTMSLATRIITMVLVKYSVFCFRILYHVGQSTLCDVIMVTKTSS